MRGATLVVAAALLAAASGMRPSEQEAELAPQEEMRFLEKGNEGNATAENATVACEHGVLKDALCHCNIGWTGEACDLAVKLPPKKDEAPKATVDYQYSAEDRWVCPQGCSTHGKCDEEARTCSCESGWDGQGCQRVEFFADRSKPSLEEADTLPVTGTVLAPGAQAPKRAKTMHAFLIQMRTSITKLQDKVRAERDDLSGEEHPGAEARAELEEDEEELQQVNRTLFSVGGFRRLDQEVEDYRRAQLEELKRRYDEQTAKAVEKEREQVVEDTVQDVLRRTVVSAGDQSGPEEQLGNFKMFHDSAPAAKLDSGKADKAVQDVEIGDVFDHEVERHAMSPEDNKRGSFILGDMRK